MCLEPLAVHPPMVIADNAVPSFGSQVQWRKINDSSCGGNPHAPKRWPTVIRRKCGRTWDEFCGDRQDATGDVIGTRVLACRLCRPFSVAMEMKLREARLVPSAVIGAFCVPLDLPSFISHFIVQWLVPVHHGAHYRTAVESIAGSSCRALP